jgi:signal peptidase II
MSLKPGLAIAAGVLVADQLSKWWILEVARLPEIGRLRLLDFGTVGMDFAMVWNRGVTFGLLAGDTLWHRVGLAMLALAVVAFLVRWLTRAENRTVTVALGAVIGGAIGNVIDRLRFGAVVDFVDTWVAGWHWYVFNVADAAIVLGVVALMADALFRPKQAGKEVA